MYYTLGVYKFDAQDKYCVLSQKRRKGFAIPRNVIVDVLLTADSRNKCILQRYRLFGHRLMRIFIIANMIILYP